MFQNRSSIALSEQATDCKGQYLHGFRMIPKIPAASGLVHGSNCQGIQGIFSCLSVGNFLRAISVPFQFAAQLEEHGHRLHRKIGPRIESSKFDPCWIRWAFARTGPREAIGVTVLQRPVPTPSSGRRRLTGPRKSRIAEKPSLVRATRRRAYVRC
jgi:hypothetical protein